MASKRKLSTKLNHRRLTRQQEAFCVLVAQGTPPTEAVEQIYPDNSSPSRYARELLDSAFLEVVNTKYIYTSITLNGYSVCCDGNL